MQAEASALSLVSLQGVRREPLVTSQSIYRPTPLPSHAILPTHTFVRTNKKGPVSCTRSNPPLVLFVCGLFLLLQNCLGCLLLLRCHMEHSSMSNGEKVGAGWWKKKLLSDKKDKDENAGANSYCQRTVQNSKQTHNYLDSRVLSSLKPEKITAAIPALGLAWLSKKIMNVEVLRKLVKRDTIHMEQIPTIIPSQKVGEGGRTRQCAHFCCLFQLLLTAPNSHSPPHTSSAMALSMSVSTCEGWNPQR